MISVFFTFGVDPNPRYKAWSTLKLDYCFGFGPTTIPRHKFLQWLPLSSLQKNKHLFPVYLSIKSKHPHVTLLYVDVITMCNIQRKTRLAFPHINQVSPHLHHSNDGTKHIPWCAHHQQVDRKCHDTPFCKEKMFFVMYQMEP